ncbi:phosphoglycerate mutase-like protein [Dichomitus squalens]|uniref:Phosphoglycerate mutase-like protein n=1 Tax=Dichomitus squalens TaxID=114155 RepID=A0A4Q9N3V3_9APHY|nr:phosphoglycerate mutase-like protein [Dichomitus squalens]
MVASSFLLFLSTASVVAAYPSASSWAGSTESAVYPPPGATNTAINTYFPDAEQVGHPGPTPTGDEAWVLETAPVAPVKADVYPLINPVEGQAPVSTPGFNPMRYWGNLSPWWSLGENAFGLKSTAKVPTGCELTQVHLLHRHGARYPTDGSSPSKFAAKLHAAANSTGFTATGPLEFLNTWTYKLGAEILTPFGREQLFDLGIAFRVKYGHLLEGFKNLPVFRTNSNARMVDSALHFAAGFFGVQQYQSSYHQVIVIEDDPFYDALTPWDACPNSGNDNANLGIIAAGNWSQIYLNKTVARLQQHIDGLELDVSTVQSMQQLCAYETVALGYSEFCDLFTEEEWKGYEYALDLEIWYSYGPGSPSAAAQGIGYVQELLARLTQTPITNFSTTLNQTIDGNNVTFPLDQPIYVDATHDTVITTVLTALNLSIPLTRSGPLPVNHIAKDHSYIASHLVPFAANVVGQVLSCPAANGTHKESYIRFLLNDGVVPLTGVSHCTENKDGLCLVDSFVQGLQERIAEVDFQYDCFANYTAGFPDNIIDGRMKH